MRENHRLLMGLFPTMLQWFSTFRDKYRGRVRDLISELPDDVLYSIVKCLTLRDAVKTCVLSHGWKGVYLSLSDLHFSQYNMFHTSTECSQCEEKFVRGVNQFLNSYQGAQIDYFCISFCLGSDFTDEIDRWVSFSNRMRANKISIWLYCGCCAMTTGDQLHGARVEGKYVIRKEVFGGRNSNLKYLELNGCNLGPNIANQFSCLETLKLVSSCLATYDMHGLFSSLVKLKHLSFFRCTLPAKLCLRSLVLLECVVISWSPGIEEVQISDNVNLYSVTCSCIQLVRFDFAGAPNLQKFHYCAPRTDKLRYIFTRLPKHAPALTTLSITTTFDTVDRQILKGINSFEQVTELCLLFFIDTELDFSKIISVLGTFPCLHKLIILKSGSGESEQGNFVPDESEDKLDKDDGTSNQIEFDNYLLKRGIFMEHMVFKQGEKFEIGSRNGLYRKVSKRLLEFSEEAAMYIR